MRDRTTIIPCASLLLVLAAAGNAAAQPVGFADPTPAEASVVSKASVQVRLDVACSFDPATLSMRLNGTALDANAFRPFGACASGRMQSQTVTVPVAPPNTQIVQGRRRRPAGTSGPYVATTDGDGAIVWNFDGAAPPQTGASVNAFFPAQGKFKVRARSTRTQTLQVAGGAAGVAVSAQRTFRAGDAKPAKRAVRVAMPPDVDFVNFEAGHVHPIAFDPARSRLYAVNTPEGRLSIFDVGDDGIPVFAGDVPVGLDPVSVAVRPGTKEVWVANHLSDTVSVVDVVKKKLVATLHPGDEPTDVAFAGNRAFVTVAGKDDRVVVYRASGRKQIASLPLFGDDPRALAVSPSGDEVYAIVLESGNRTTAIFEPIVALFGGLPPPTPPRKASLPAAVSTGIIVKEDPATGTWLDETGRDWTDAVDYSLPDHDVFVIDALATPPQVVRTVSGVGTTLYDVTVHPSGELWVANTDARNLVRFEPKLRGHTIDTRVTRVDPDAASVIEAIDLNPHVDYATTPGPANEIAASLSQPTNGVFDAAGQTYYVAALGSAKVAVLSSSGDVIAQIPVGRGPSGVALDEARARLFVLNRFEQTISIVDTVTRSEVARVGVTGPARFDASPEAIRKGRRFLYDATLSRHGDSACATCHLFGNFDGLAWDLGNPQGDFVPYTDARWAEFFFPFGPSQQGFDPQKGPMTTQTLRGLAGNEPFHWRGDRRDFAAFDEAFVEILGAASPPPKADMRAFTDFVMSLHFPPNPFRAVDDTLPASIAVPAYDGSTTTGDPRRGESDFHDGLHVASFFNCVDCHAMPVGTSNMMFNGELEMDTQDFKIPHLRNMYEKIGLLTFRTGGQTGGPQNDASFEQKGGFGVLHDGSVSLKEFLAADLFFLTESQENDMFAFMLAFPTGTPSCVGQQATLRYRDRGDGSLLTRIATLVAQAQQGRCDLIVKGFQRGVAKGFVLDGSSLRPDDPLEPVIAEADLRAALAAGDVLTYTTVPRGSGRRLGIDRDRDGFLDREERRTGSDPGDPRSNAWSWAP